VKITVLGSASGISMPGRGHACVAVESGGALYLLDAGEPVGREVLARKLPIEKLRAVFVSHMHVDHVGGLLQMVKNFDLYHNHPEYLPQLDRVTIGLPAEAVEAVKEFFVACYSFPERMKVRVDYLPIAAGRFYEDEYVSVEAHRTTHLDGVARWLAAHPQYAGPKGEAFSFEIRGEGKRVFYSGDLGKVDDIMPAARGADLLVLEFGHLLPLEENLAKLAPLGVRRIVLTHIFPDYTDKGAELQGIADRVLPGIVTVAADGSETVI
jgi:ribonuclease BN (tRNA processing enzyme)